jgi:hypothetical protein
VKPLEAFHVDRRRSSGRTAQCAECRKAHANFRKYPTACIECGRHRRLDPNSVCAKCNRARGLRYCRGCRAMLPALLSFYAERAVCKDCKKKGPTAGDREPLG